MNPRTLVRKAGSACLSLGARLHQWAAGSMEPSPSPPSPRTAGESLALVAGYFSFPDGFATFGDTESMKVVCRWLEDTDVRYDLACHHSNGVNGVDLAGVDPGRYDIFIFVCGPWRHTNTNLLGRFHHCVKIGVNLSIEDESGQGFDLLYPRDLGGQSFPDLVLATEKDARPKVGICLVHDQAEYGERQRHHHVRGVVEALIEGGTIVPVFVDTLHADNPYGIPSASSLEAVLSGLDVLVSTRLHGMVFALKMGVPVVAIDAIAGRAKVTKQAKALGWPVVLGGDDLEVDLLADAIRTCLQKGGRERARAVGQHAAPRIRAISTRFKTDLQKILQDR